MVAGDVVNTTARIQAAAAPGTVLVDEATRRTTEAAIACEPAGSFELKGKSRAGGAVAGGARGRRRGAATAARSGWTRRSWAASASCGC